MIFQETHEKVGYEKIETRRIEKPEHSVVMAGDVIMAVRINNRTLWQTFESYAVQPGRGMKGERYITLTAIRRERLWDIDEQGAKREGFGSRAEFVECWKRLHHKKGRRWEDNPKVFVLCVEPEEGFRGRIDP